MDNEIKAALSNVSKPQIDSVRELIECKLDEQQCRINIQWTTILIAILIIIGICLIA